MKVVSLLLTLPLLISKLYAGGMSESATSPWGIDSDLLCVCKPHRESVESKTPRLSLGQKSCRSMIRFFQNYISDIDGPRSSFYPTSSQYALEAIQIHGVLRGIAMGCDRLLRENGEMWVYETTIKHGTARKLDLVRPKENRAKAVLPLHLSQDSSNSNDTR